MTETLTGRCLCGATTLTAEAPPKFGIHCYCRDCQHVSGGAGTPQVGFDAGSVRVEGPLKRHEGVADSGNALHFGFCGECGSPITKATARAPDLLFVYAAVLDDPGAVPELRPVFEEARPGWDRRD